MDIHEAIRTRRSIGKVKPDPVEPVLIHRILEAGTWAPNHYLTQPWKFFVMTGEGRKKKLGQVWANLAAEGLGDVTAEQRQEAMDKASLKAERSPVVIGVAVSPPDNKHAVEVEEYAAVHAAIQNMLLTAHALGLGAVWRTGDAAYHPFVKQIFGLSDREAMAGFIYVGYPDIKVPMRKRAAVEDKTVWFD